ncbi:MAG TPA: dTMP kinase [Acidisarcina sp.]
MSSGFFVTFEGLDGSGKTTQLRKLANFLERRGEPVLVTRQPGGTAIGDRIRTLLLDSRTDSQGEPMAPLAELGLMFSDRAQTIDQVIRPALVAGKIVLCDRFTDSTEAYQGGGRNLGSELVLQMHAVMCGGLQPDLTFLLLPDFDASLARARRRNERNFQAGKDEGRFEREQEPFYRRVFEKYKEIAAREPNRISVIDGDAQIQTIHDQILATLTERFKRQR